MSTANENANTNYLMVKQFNQVFGHAAPEEPQTDIFTNSPHIVTLRNSLIHEEINELKEALEQEDVIETIKGFLDSESSVSDRPIVQYS